jgi:hypothetical protein
VGLALGLGVKVVATISSVLAGLTARLASLSWLVSALDRLGIILTRLTLSVISAASPALAEQAFDLGNPLHGKKVKRVCRLEGGVRRPL